MKNAAFLFDSFHEKEDALLRFIEKVVKNDYRNKDLHKLRVSIKKMRAALLLLELATDGRFNSKRRIKSVKPLFKTAGTVREFYVSLETLNGYWLSKQAKRLYKEHLQARIEQDGKKLLQAVRDFEPKKLEKTSRQVKEICAGMTVSELRARARIFIMEKISRIQQLIRHNPGVDELHDARRQLRSITTLGKLFRETGLSVMPQKRLKQLKDLEQLSGAWHDLEVLADIVEKFTGDLPPNPVRDEWRALLRKLKAENQEQTAVLKKELAVV